MEQQQQRKDSRAEYGVYIKSLLTRKIPLKISWETFSICRIDTAICQSSNRFFFFEIEEENKIIWKYLFKEIELFQGWRAGDRRKPPDQAGPAAQESAAADEDRHPGRLPPECVDARPQRRQVRIEG